MSHRDSPTNQLSSDLHIKCNPSQTVISTETTVFLVGNNLCVLHDYYHPLFGVRSWNKGMHCMPLYILMMTSEHWNTFHITYSLCVRRNFLDKQCCNSGTFSFMMNYILQLFNKMNPEYFPQAATTLKPQQIPMFLHISARVWGRRWSPYTSEQKGYMLKPQ